MTHEQARKLIAQLAIAAAVCAGVHAIGAGPLRTRALAAEAELASFIDQHDMNAAVLADLPRVVETRQLTDAGVRRFASRNQPALDESAMFTQVLDLAAQSGVSVEQVIPAGEGQRDVTLPAGAKPRPGDRRTRYTLVGGGSYGATTDFLERLQGDWAYCAVRQCRITPDYQAGSGGAVRFSLLLELFSFDAAPISLTPGTEGAP
ncbi:MAG: hypothetical protein IT431_11290 [Phycisphaerales bacterium]|nr:hypothetical protein [Phycisphaerales bacterium]